MTIDNIYNAIISFDETAIKKNVLIAIERGISAKTILNEGLISALEDVGDKYSAGEIFVPEMLLAAQTMKSGMEILKPYLIKDKNGCKGKIIIGSVKGDLHDIGKNLVATMIEGAGYKVIDLGVDVDSDKFIQNAAEKNADIIALSALLTTTMPYMYRTVNAIKESGIKVKTIVGGAPITQSFADEIHADGYSVDAPGAVKIVKILLKKGYKSYR